MIEDYGEALEALKANSENEYDSFNNVIVNSGYPTLGVRLPIVKKIAASVASDKRDGFIEAFIKDEHKTHESVLLAGLVAARKGDYQKTREYIKLIAPFFASWAHTDSVVPQLRWTDTDRFLADFDYLLSRTNPYEKRVYIIYLMNKCLTAERIGFVMDVISERVEYGEYYVDMGVAWLVAEALIKQYEKAITLLENKTLPPFVHNKAIQKARESYRVSPETKEYLSTLKIKE